MADRRMMGQGQATDLQRQWASPLGRFSQGYVVDPLLGALQFGSRMREPDMIPLYGMDEEALHAQAAKAADRLVNQTEHNYNAARVTVGQDAGGTDWLRWSGNFFSPSPLGKLKGGSLGRRVLEGGATEFVQSLFTNPVNTEDGNSYEQEKFQDATLSAAMGGALPVAGAGLAKLVDPKIASGPRGLLDVDVPLTLGQTLGGAAQRLENRLADAPVIGPPIRAAQQRSADGLYQLRMDADPAPIPMTMSGKSDPLAESLSDLRGIPAPAKPAVGLTGLLSNAVYSKPGQAVLRTVVANRPEGAGLIGDYLRDEISFGTAARGLLSGPR